MPKIDDVRRLNSRFKKALVLENPDTSLDEYLREQGMEVERVPESLTTDREAILELLRNGQHDLIYKRSRFIVDEEVLAASENLAAVMLCCIGDDSVDKEACARAGVLVMNDPKSNARSVVELVFGEMICLARRIFESNDVSHRHEWTKNNRQRYEIKGKTLGVIGLGNIGTQVAQMGQAFGMDIVFYDDREVAREVGSALGWRACRTMREALRASDIVTVHTSAENYRGQSNKNMIGYEDLKELGSERDENSPRMFINAGRGFLYEPDDLVRAVREGFVRTAAVDVFPVEPGSGSDGWENPYADLPQIVTTPHIGAATQEAQPRIAAYVAGTTRMFNCSGRVRSCVYSPGHVIGVDTDRPNYLLTVVHSDARGTKKAIADSIYDAGLNNIESSHIDFSKYGFAYDVSAMDRPLSEAQIEDLIERARTISGDPTAIRSIRQIKLSSHGHDDA